MLTLSPFLLFNGHCAEAMEFYHTALGGDLIITRLGDTPMKDQMPPALHQKVVNARLNADAISFTATDWLHPTRVFQQGNTVGLYINGDNYGELKKLFDKLSEGGDPTMFDELREMPFGSYGHFADKYGVHWFFRGEKKS